MSVKKQRILFVERPPFVGGSITGLFELVRGIDREKYEPVMLFHGPNPYREKFRELGFQVETLSEELPSLESTVQKRDIAAALRKFSGQLANGYLIAKELYLKEKRDRPLAKRIAGMIKRLEIDLVHNNNSLPGNRATIMAAQMAGVPQLSHVRMLHTFSFIERRLARSVDGFIFMSTAIEKLYQDLGIPASKGRVIYDAFDMQPYENLQASEKLRAEFGFDAGDFIVCIVGRIEWWKGHDDFIRAMAEVLGVLPNAKALIIGSPDPTASGELFHQKILALIDELEMKEHVLFTGFRTDIPQLMAMSDVVVHGSSQPEPFGRVVVEAMLAGSPVIGTAAGGVLDIIDDKETGLLVPCQDPKAMAKAILYLAQHPESAKEMSVKAKREAMERFSVGQHVQKVQSLYEALLN